jgi:hypothetical protein
MVESFECSWIGTMPEMVDGQEQREAMRAGAARVKVRARRAGVVVIGNEDGEAGRPTCCNNATVVEQEPRHVCERV